MIIRARFTGRDQRISTFLPGERRKHADLVFLTGSTRTVLPAPQLP